MHYFNQLINTQYKEEFENMPMTLMARALPSIPPRCQCQFPKLKQAISVHRYRQGVSTTNQQFLIIILCVDPC